MHEELERLTRAHPLPASFSEPELFADDVTLGDVAVRRAGIACTAPGGLELTGSAAELEGSPIARAYYELLERAALIDAAERACTLRDGSGHAIGVVAPEPSVPQRDPRSRPARSNGVALHGSWGAACARAREELAERDRVLRSWYGELPVIETLAPEWLAAISTHAWRAAWLPSPTEGAMAADVEVAVVLGFPTRASAPLARGFAGRGTLDQALAAAAKEAVQGLAFLCDEPLPPEVPRPSPTPMFHLDYYLWPAHHAHLRAWLAGAHLRAHPRDAGRSSPGLAETRFADLTPDWLGDGLRVARALNHGARELVFGEPPTSIAAGLPGSHVHPIP